MILHVVGRLPGLNELLAGKASQNGSWNHYNQLKAQWYGQIKLLCRARGVEPVGPGYFTLLFCEPDRRRDPDNVVAGGAKLLFDSLVGAGVMAGDSWAHVLGFIGYWVHKPGRAGCLVHWSETQIASKEAMVAMLGKEIGENANKEDGDGARTAGHGANKPNFEGAAGGNARAGRQLVQLSNVGRRGRHAR